MKVEYSVDGMFKKREKPGASRKTEEGSIAEADGASGSVPVAERSNKRLRLEGSDKAIGLLGASTRKADGDVNAAALEKGADMTFSGWRASGELGTKAATSDATRVMETETAHDKDNRSILERNEQINKGLVDGTLDKNEYRGQSAYKRYANRSEGAISASKYSGLLGPTRGMSNVRMTMNVEYWGTSGQGGICKDYKETGYCGFGDSCKFLHDRSDYKAGYQLDKEWEEQQKAIETKKRKHWEKRMRQKGLAQEGELDDADASGDADSSDDDADAIGLPSTCYACSERWEKCKSMPIVTTCGHHFCEDCAMEHFAKTPKCMACDAPTGGIFNACDALEEKVKKAKERAKEAKSEAAAASSGHNGSKVPYGMHCGDD